MLLASCARSQTSGPFQPGHAALVGLPDDQILAYATAEGRALVTANIRDFIPLDTRYRAAGPSQSDIQHISPTTNTNRIRIQTDRDD